MKKLCHVFIFIAAVYFPCFVCSAKDKKDSIPQTTHNLTMTTYYPAPTGNYDKLSAAGGVKLGNQATAIVCDQTAAGTVRYNNIAVPRLEFCNGSTWEGIGVTFQDHLPGMPPPPKGLKQWPNHIVCPTEQGDNWMLPLNGVSEKSSIVHYVIALSSIRIDYTPTGDLAYFVSITAPCSEGNIATLCKDYPERCIF